VGIVCGRMIYADERERRHDAYRRRQNLCSTRPWPSRSLSQACTSKRRLSRRNCGRDGNSGWVRRLGLQAHRTDRGLYKSSLIAATRLPPNCIGKTCTTAARPRAEGSCDRGVERRRHCAVGSEGSASRRAGARLIGGPLRSRVEAYATALPQAF